MIWLLAQMPRPQQWFEKFDLITANFAYIRLLGDRKGIEEKTKRWDKVIIDRTRDCRNGSVTRGKSSGEASRSTST